jgi:hypothetical protein
MVQHIIIKPAAPSIIIHYSVSDNIEPAKLNYRFVTDVLSFSMLCFLKQVLFFKIV